MSWETDSECFKNPCTHQYENEAWMHTPKEIHHTMNPCFNVMSPQYDPWLNSSVHTPSPISPNESSPCYNPESPGYGKLSEPDYQKYKPMSPPFNGPGTSQSPPKAYEFAKHSSSSSVNELPIDCLPSPSFNDINSNESNAFQPVNSMNSSPQNKKKTNDEPNEFQMVFN